ncbi:MAG: primosomal protein N' [Nocardioidaceae bacterium]
MTRPSDHPGAASGAAAHLPVARVAVAVSLAHLDRPFDYEVPADLDGDVLPGCRVMVRFAGRLVSGLVLARTAHSEHMGKLARITRAVSPEVVLTHDIAGLCRTVADHYAGCFADVTRLAVPARHARIEREEHGHSVAAVETSHEPVWPDEPAGATFLSRLADGESPRAAWSTPTTAWPDRLAAAATAALSSGRGTVICVPDVRDVTRVDTALTAALGPGNHVVLTADLGPSARYRAFLALARGEVRIVVGTRAAAFAPARDLGLVVVWDDGDDLHAEPRAPYPHVREVLLMRAHHGNAGALLAAHARSTDVQALVESGWCTELSEPPARRRVRSPRVRVGAASDHALARDPAARSARLPSEALDAVRTGLTAGPVLVQVPRRGYRVALACQRCRQPARCEVCAGPLGQSAADAVPACRWCAALASGWRCPHCGGTALRAPVLGESRTAEELGRSFPQVVVRHSTGGHLVDAVGPAPAIVVATPGAEPPAADGYAAAVLLDTWLMLDRSDLRTGEEALRRWCNAVSLVRPVDRGGQVVAVGDPRGSVLQALVRADPAGFAVRELGERRAARLPPAVRLATVTGPITELAGLTGWTWPDPAEVLGPVPLDGETARLVVRTPRSRSSALAAALRALQATRSARKLPTLRVQVDPAELG